MKSKNFGVLSLITGCILLAGICWHFSRWRQLDGYVEEVGGAFETIFSVSCAENDLFYGYGSPAGNELHRVDIKSGRQERIPMFAPIMRLFPVSPDRRFMLLKALQTTEQPPPNSTTTLTEWMTVFDRSTHTVLPVKQMSSIGKYPVWLDAQSFIFTGRDLNKGNTTEEYHFVDTMNPTTPKPLSAISSFASQVLTNSQQNLIHTADMKIALEVDGEIAVLDLKESRIEQLSRFGGQMSSLAWLTYSKETGRFLFCSTRKGENYRNLFLFEPQTQQITRLTTEHTYNGQWIEGGTGYAFIGNTNNSFYLGVRPLDQERVTNLFAGGFVERYTVSSDGSRICTVASTNAEPRALWEYDISKRTLRMLLAGNKVPFRNAVVSAPTEMTIASFDRLPIPTYLFPPKNYQPNRKYPLVVYVPPRTAQCSRGYEIQAQLLANIGFFYLGVNYRGCDGYGKKYSEMWDLEMAARDVLAVMEWASMDPRFDSKQIFVTSISDSSLILQRLLVLNPQIAKAVVFESPAQFDFPESSGKMTFPDILVSMGKQDPLFQFARRLQDWARANSVSARFYYIDGFGHPGTTEIIRARVEQERETAKFLLNSL